MAKSKIEQEFDCKFIRIDPDKEDSLINVINEIFGHTKQWSHQMTKKTFIDRISMRVEIR